MNAQESEASITRPVRHTGFLTLLAVGLSLPATIEAQERSSVSARPSDEGAPLRAFELSGNLEINLDGRIDEAAWQRATPISDFTQQEPVQGNEPSEPTEIRVVFDEDHLYIGAIVYDDPQQILAFQRERDASLGTDDRFMWILDTFLDGRTGYFFEINAAGLMGDGVITGGGGR
ncbi:MAG TPA: hypothetical protein DCY33_04945, partial [Gemmatimonadetes bacterium]|nr:hypothetical protein [Gemmatimonadota bacterium]